MAVGDFTVIKQVCEDERAMTGRQARSQLSLLTSGYETVREDQGEVADTIHGGGGESDPNISIVHLPPKVYLLDSYRYSFEASTSAGPAELGLVSKWRMKDRMKTGCVALVLCLNIGVDPPDVIKISPCARMECWIDPFSMSAPKALDAIGKTLQAQYERWQPRARYKLQLDPTVEEAKKLCFHCRKSAKSERVLFHYNGHGVPRPTLNGEIWLFNKTFTQYIPLSVYELESWLGTPSIYVFDCSGAGMILNAFRERPEWDPGRIGSSSMKDCILLAACGSNEMLPQHAELPADVFTSCLTTPIKIALRWFCPRSLLRDSLDPELIDRIPGRQNDRKTPLGELNWIFTAITDTIAWNVLPRDLFQRLFRQDLLVASLFRNFLLAERIMRAANCSPQSYPCLPPTHQHPMWQAWDMAAEICLSQLPDLLTDSADFKPSSFFTEQLTAFEVWLDHGSKKKKPPEQLPIVLQVLLSQSHRFRALVLLGRFLDMGAWAVDLALSVGIFPYVLKLLQTIAMELRQILVFIWTKILALDKSCQVDLVKDGGHQYFIRFLGSPDIYAEQRAMAAFVLAVIVDGYRKGQEGCMKFGLINICLKHIQYYCMGDGQPETALLLQWLCLCLGKLWDEFPDAQLLGVQENAPTVLMRLLLQPHPEVRASATFALGTLISSDRTEVVGENSSLDDDFEDDERVKRHHTEQEIADILIKVLYDGSPLVRTELAIGLSRLVIGHNKHLKCIAAAYMKCQASSILTSLPGLTSMQSPGGSYARTSQMVLAGGSVGLSPDSVPEVDSVEVGNPLDVSEPSLLSPSSNVLQCSPLSDGLAYPSKDAQILGNGTIINDAHRPQRPKAEATGFYSRCVDAIFVLGQDPSPHVASLGQQMLRMLGVSYKNVTHRGPNPSLSSSVGHSRNSGSLSGMHRSFSFIDSTPGNIVTFRTPPASPPTGQSLLAGTGMRKVYSLEFKPHMRVGVDTGLADTALVGVGVPNMAEAPAVPASRLYTWSCGHFSQPLLEPYHDDDEEASIRREERERLAMDGISKCQHSNVTRVSDQIASWDLNAQICVKSVLLHPFMPIVCFGDENEVVRIWDYEEGALLNSFQNRNFLEKGERGFSRLCLLNELDDSLLLVASSDGCARIWRDYTQKSKQQLVTAWQTIQGHRADFGSINAVMDWQQWQGYLYSSGEIPSMMLWDLNHEKLASVVSVHSDHSVTALAGSQGLDHHVITGFSDGTVKVFDIRYQDIVCEASLHKHKVVSVGFLPGMDSNKLVSASQGGDIKFVDMRKNTSPYLVVDAHKGSLSAMAIHRYAPFIASGSSKQYIKVFDINGEPLSVIRYHNSFLGQRIGPVSSLAFHPYKVYLAAGATDSYVSIYSGDGGISR